MRYVEFMNSVATRRAPRGERLITELAVTVNLYAAVEALSLRRVLELAARQEMVWS